MYKSWAFLLYADDIVLISSNESELQLLIDEVHEFVEYGMKVSELKSHVFCMNGEQRVLPCYEKERE